MESLVQSIQSRYTSLKFPIVCTLCRVTFG